jgi:hypothetical protein
MTKSREVDRRRRVSGAARGRAQFAAPDALKSEGTLQNCVDHPAATIAHDRPNTVHERNRFACPRDYAVPPPLNSESRACATPYNAHPRQCPQLHKHIEIWRCCDHSRVAPCHERKTALAFQEPSEPGERNCIREHAWLEIPISRPTARRTRVDIPSVPARSATTPAACMS